MKFSKNGCLVTTLSVLVSCGGAGEGSGDASSASEVLSSLTQGYAVPQSISTIPAENSAQQQASSAISLNRSLKKSLKRSGKAEASSVTDFEAAGEIELKISEPALDQFSIIETIMATLKQTNYWETKVINKGSYKSLVKWEEGDDIDYEYWTVNSKMIVIDGKDVNRVRFWIDGDQGTKGMMDIYSAPTGTNSYGEWRLDVSFDKAGQTGLPGTFAAAADLQSDGSIKLSIDGDMMGSAGVLYLKSGVGKGIVKYADWNSCNSEDCTPSSITAKMSYNEDHAIIQKDSKAARCKDRAAYSDIYMDYKLYDSAGADVNKTKTYSFPLKYNGQYYYYGGWNGRQQLWGEGAKDLAVNTELNHAEHDNSSSFTIDSRVKGILTKKAGTEVDLTNNTTIAAGVGTDTLQGSDWSNSKNFMLVHDGAWKYCNDYEFNWDLKTCSNLQSFGAGDAATIANTDAIFSAHNTNNYRVQVTDFDDRQWSNIIDGKANAAAFTSALDDSLVYRVSYEKMIFIQYDSVTDTRWETCEANYPANDPWNPTLSNCTALNWDTLAEDWGKFSRHFWTNGGTQYLATIDESTSGSGTGALLKLVKKKEIVVKDAIAGSLTGRNYDGTASGKTYTYGAGLQLVDNSNSSIVDQWTAQIFDNAGNEYQWEYSKDGDWDVMTYLAYGVNAPSGKSQGDLVVFDAALKFDSITAKNVGGDSVDLSNLVFDGWLSGLPDVWKMLEGNRQKDADSGLTPSQKSKIINIPSGTSIVDSLSDTYKIKPRYGVRILDDIDVGSCTTSIDADVSLSDGITYKAHGVGADPEISEVTVMEGQFIDE